MRCHKFLNALLREGCSLGSWRFHHAFIETVSRQRRSSLTPSLWTSVRPTRNVMQFPHTRLYGETLLTSVRSDDLVDAWWHTWEPRRQGFLMSASKSLCSHVLRSDQMYTVIAWRSSYSLYLTFVHIKTIFITLVSFFCFYPGQQSLKMKESAHILLTKNFDFRPCAPGLRESKQNALSVLVLFC